MPLLRHLDFAARDLHVAYCASLEPQELHIDVKTAGPAAKAEAEARIGTIIANINAGAAGGDVFHPAAGSAALLAGTSGHPSNLGPDYQFRLQVAGVAPLYLRTIVEELRWVGFNQPVSFMSIVGTRPLDSTPLSVQSAAVRAWLDDPSAYLPRWPKPEFDVSDHEAYGASIHVQLLDPLTLSTELALRDAVMQWVVMTQQYVDGEGREVVRILHHTLPRDGASRTGYRAMCEEFLHTSGPSRAALINILTRYHRTVAPIAMVQIGLR